jgi:uncharacterized protein (DUF1778 family)
LEKFVKLLGIFYFYLYIKHNVQNCCNLDFKYKKCNNLYMCQIDTLTKEINMVTSLPRITARIDLDTQELLLQAATIIGISSINSFVLNAAIEKAKKIMEDEHSLKLNQRDAMMLVNALDTPAKANARLQQAAKCYKSKKQS